MKVRITRRRMPKHAVAAAKIKRDEAEIIVPEDSMSIATANMLSAMLTHIAKKLGYWDIRNPKVLAGIGCALVSVFTVGFIVAPKTVENIIWDVLPGSNTGQADPPQTSGTPREAPKLVSGDQPLHHHVPHHLGKRTAAKTVGPATPKPSTSSGAPAPTKSSSAPAPNLPTPSSPAPPNPSDAPPAASDPGPVVSPPALLVQPPPNNSVPDAAAAPPAASNNQGLLSVLSLLTNGLL